MAFNNSHSIWKDFREFMQFESAGGIVLFLAAVIALIIVNSPAASLYIHFFDTQLAVHIGGFYIDKSLRMWVDDGLMAIFFLLVGLEIKRELVNGELNNLQKASLPIVSALGGILVPAGIYAAINWSDPIAVHGWAIPSATDIAFALGVLALLGSRVPTALKVFLTAIAILDDLAAIIIIALFYSDNLALYYLSLAAVCSVILIFFNRLGVKRLSPYMLVGIVLWATILKSGVHATLAGVILAFTIPMNTGVAAQRKSPARWLEHGLHPWVAFGVLPIFAFANAGIPLTGITFDYFVNPVPLGIIVGLFIGKPLGIFSFCWLAVKCRLAKLPEQLTWTQVYGMSIVCGIGFTMSLFIGMLAFDDVSGDFDIMIRVGVFTGSLLSGLLGYLVLRFTINKNQVEHNKCGVKHNEGIDQTRT